MERTGNTLESDVEAVSARLQQSFSVSQFVFSVHFYVCTGGLVNVKEIMNGWIRLDFDTTVPH